MPMLGSVPVSKFGAAEKELLRAMEKVSESECMLSTGRPRYILNELGVQPSIPADKLHVGDCLLFPRIDNVFPLHSVALTWLFRALFDSAAALSESSIDRYDLHHAHWWHNRDSGHFGLLWHAREYPAQDEDLFPHNLGYCQLGSTLHLREWTDMLRRNILWVAGANEMQLLNPLPVVDKDFLQGVWTVDETILGRRIADIYYFGRRRTCSVRGDVFLVPYI
jgi:hypothetical protein